MNRSVVEPLARGLWGVLATPFGPGLEVDEERMRANVAAETLSEAARFGIDVTDPADYLGAADAFVTRALVPSLLSVPPSSSSSASI